MARRRRDALSRGRALGRHHRHRDGRADRGARARPGRADRRRSAHDVCGLDVRRRAPRRGVAGARAACRRPRRDPAAEHPRVRGRVSRAQPDRRDPGDGIARASTQRSAALPSRIGCGGLRDPGGGRQLRLSRDGRGDGARIPRARPRSGRGRSALGPGFARLDDGAGRRHGARRAVRGAHRLRCGQHDAAVGWGRRRCRS